MMRGIGITFLGIVLSFGTVRGQERIPPEKATQYGLLLSFTASREKDPQVITEIDFTKVSAMTGKEKQIVIFIPDKKISADAITKIADKTILPVGQLWMAGISPKIKDELVPKEQLRIVYVSAGREQLKAPLCFVGLQKNGEGKLELLIYGKGKEPLLRPLLEGHESKQELPVEVDLEFKDEKPHLVNIKLLGKHRTTIEIGPNPVPAAPAKK